MTKPLLIVLFAKLNIIGKYIAELCIVFMPTPFKTKTSFFIYFLEEAVGVVTVFTTTKKGVSYRHDFS